MSLLFLSLTIPYDLILSLITDLGAIAAGEDMG